MNLAFGWCLCLSDRKKFSCRGFCWLDFQGLPWCLAQVNHFSCRIPYQGLCPECPPVTSYKKTVVFTGNGIIFLLISLTVAAGVSIRLGDNLPGRCPAYKTKNDS
jgi:hypothetical protein